jgi:hypothetical protein
MPHIYYKMHIPCGTCEGQERCALGFGGEKETTWNNLCSWNDGRKIVPQEIGMGGDWTGLGQGKVAVCCERGDEPSRPVKCGVFLD